MYDIKADGDVFNVEIPEKGPARIIVKVAPTKDKAGNWKSTFQKLKVWGSGREPVPGAELVTRLQPRDKIRFTGYAQTDAWTTKEGQDRTELVVNCTRLELGTWPKGGADDGPAGGPLQQPDFGDSVPF